MVFNRGLYKVSVYGRGEAPCAVAIQLVSGIPSGRLPVQW